MKSTCPPAFPLLSLFPWRRLPVPPGFHARVASTSLIFLLALLGLARPAKAQLTLSNLSSAVSGTISISTSQRIAASFTVGSASLTLTSLKVTLGGTPVSGTTFQLRSDASGSPASTSLLTFTNPTFSSGIKTYTFVPPTSFDLLSGVTYWVAAFSSASSSAWERTSPQTNPSGVGATFGTYKISSNSGTSWSANSVVNGMALEVDGVAAIPEPAAYATLAGAAMLLVAIYRRRVCLG